MIVELNENELIMTGAQIIDTLIDDYISNVDEDERRKWPFSEYAETIRNINWDKQYVIDSQITYLKEI